MDQVLEGRIREGHRIELDKFRVSEWLPISPGRYFTNEASHAREHAKRYLQYNREFLPLGKEQMVLGGIGSVRLKHRRIEGRELYFLGASENGISHQGIPLILERDLAEDLLDDIASTGGSVCQLRGQVSVLDDSISLISYDTGIPKYAISVERVTMIRSLTASDLLVTVAVMYPSYRSYNPRDTQGGFAYQGERNLFTKSWTFCSFSPNGSLVPIRDAANWLLDYALRYVGRTVPILTDFDEHIDHFPNTVEFPLKKVVHGEVDTALLTIYGDYYHFDLKNATNTEITMGDRFENISNAIIINRSSVEQAINKVGQLHDGAEKAEALKLLARHAQESGNQEAIELTNNFTEEVNKPQPSKSVLYTRS